MSRGKETLFTNIKLAPVKKMDWINIFKWIGYSALLVGAIGTIAVSILTDNESKKKDKEAAESAVKLNARIDTLLTEVQSANKALAPFEDLASRLYPNLDEKDALTRLRFRLDDLEGVVTKEKNIIRSFDAHLYFEFSGNWDSVPYPGWYEYSAPETYLKWKSSTKKAPDIEFKIQRVVYRDGGKQIGIFDNKISVEGTATPLGEDLNFLKNYDQIEFKFILVEPGYVKDGIISIDKLIIKFAINGSIRGEFADNSPTLKMDLRPSYKKPDDHVDATVRLEGALLQMFKNLPGS